MPNDRRSVFLSYARRASRAPVDQPYAALGGADGPAFLDRADLPYGTPIPATLADAILGARVVVVFFEPVYFTRWYCRLEYRLATALFDYDAELAARRVVLTFPDAAAAPDARLTADLDELPTASRGMSWPAASDTATLADLVRGRLESVREPIGTLLDRRRGVGAARAILTGPAVLPQPLHFGTVPRFPAAGARGSLRDGFVGRDDALWRLHQDLAPAEQRVGHAALTAALKGMGGVGKTQLAAEYFHRYGPRHYTGGLFWLDARRDAAEQHHAVLRELGDGDVGDDFVAYRERVGAARVASVLADRLARRLRAVPREHPVLLVVDDVPEQGTSSDGSPAPRGAPPLETWCPAPDAAACLATSRAVVGFQRGDALEQRTIDVLEPEPAVAVLTRSVADVLALTAEEWREIAEWVGRLPLALAVLNRALRREARALYPRRVLEAARAGASPAAHQDRTASRLANADETLRGATEAFRLSFDTLPEPAQRVARRLACLGPAPIPLALAEALAPNGADAEATADALALLLARSFVLPPGDAGNVGGPPGERTSGSVPIYGSMHTLLADAMRAFSPDPGADVRAAVAALAAAFAPDSTRDPAAWSLLAAAVPHALAALERADAVGGPSGARGLHAADAVGLLAGGLLSQIGVLTHARGDYATARAACERAQAIAECLLGPEHPATLASANNLAETLRALGDAAGARVQFERLRAVYVRVFGPEHPDTLTIVSNLALALQAQGDVAGACAEHECVLAARTRLLGPEHPDTLTSANNLAEALRVLDDSAGARTLHEHVLEARTRVLGAEDPDTLVSASNLALALHALGDLAGARTLGERVLQIRTRLLSPEHPSTLNSANNLAGMLYALGDLAGARALQEQVLTGREHLLGPEHPDTLTSAENLAATLWGLGSRTAAQALLERTVAGRTRVLGPAHPDTVQAERNLTSVIRAQSDAS